MRFESFRLDRGLGLGSPSSRRAPGSRPARRRRALRPEEPTRGTSNRGARDDAGCREGPRRAARMGGLLGRKDPDPPSEAAGQRRARRRGADLGGRSRASPSPRPGAGGRSGRPRRGYSGCRPPLLGPVAGDPEATRDSRRRAGGTCYAAESRSLASRSRSDDPRALQASSTCYARPYAAERSPDDPHRTGEGVHRDPMRRLRVRQHPPLRDLPEVRGLQPRRRLRVAGRTKPLRGLPGRGSERSRIRPGSASSGGGSSGRRSPPRRERRRPPRRRRR